MSPRMPVSEKSVSTQHHDESAFAAKGTICMNAIRAPWEGWEKTAGSVQDVHVPQSGGAKKLERQ